MLQFCSFVIAFCRGLIRLVGYRFAACPGNSPSSRGENHSDPKLGQDQDPDKSGCTTSCRGSEMDPTFLCVFSGFAPQLPTFATDS